MGLGVFFYIIFKIGFGELLCAMSRSIVQHGGDETGCYCERTPACKKSVKPGCVVP